MSIGDTMRTNRLLPVFSITLVFVLACQAGTPPATATNAPLPTQSTVPQPTTSIVPTEEIQVKPTVFPVTEIADDFGVTMVFVPDGKFEMGSTNGKPNESPVHTVSLDPYYIDKYEVTILSYKTCVNAGACQSPDYSKFDEKEFENYPVVYVEWGMANSYCEWRGARLPTEAEWEKAARGTDGRTYPWEKELTQLLRTTISITELATAKLQWVVMKKTRVFMGFMIWQVMFMNGFTIGIRATITQ